MNFFPNGWQNTIGPNGYWPLSGGAPAGGTPQADPVDQTFLELLKLLLPYGAYSDSDTAEHARDLAVQASALGLCQENADALFSECYPDETVQLLPDWESTYGITNDSDISYAARVDNLLAAINARGSLTRDYFITLAARLGYTITIEEFLPFMAGWNEAGDEIWIEDIIYVWEIVVSNSNAVSYYFEAGISCAGDSLNYFSDSYLETIYNRLKPAHTAVVFNYL